MVVGLPRTDSLNVVYDGCFYGKQYRKPFPIGKAWRAGHVPELMHADLCGPIYTKSFGGSKYFLLFTDDYGYMI